MHVFLKRLVQPPTALSVLPTTPLNAKPAKVDISNQIQVFALELHALALNF